MPIALDMNFLVSVEGFELQGMVPSKNGEPLGSSGVTVGVGVDLGQQSEKRLKDAGVSPDMIRKLKPYLGVKGSEAQRLAQEMPLILSEEEASKLSEDIVVTTLDDLITEWNKGDPSERFENLSPTKQTVVYSVLHQHGVWGAPKFLSYAKEGNWDKVDAELRDFGDIYDTRRHREADFLTSEGIQKIQREEEKILYGT